MSRQKQETDTTTDEWKSYRQLGFLELTAVSSQNLYQAILTTLIPDFEYYANQTEIVDFFANLLTVAVNPNLSLEQIVQKDGQRILTILFSRFRILSNFIPSNFNLITPKSTQLIIHSLPIVIIVTDSTSSQWYGLQYLGPSGLKDPAWNYAHPQTKELLEMLRVESKPNVKDVLKEFQQQNQILDAIAKSYSTKELDLVLTNLNDLNRLNRDKPLTKVIAYRKSLINQLRDNYDKYLIPDYDQSVFNDYVLLSKWQGAHQGERPLPL